MKSLYMETTGISVDKTIAEIQLVLGHYGASAVQLDYEAREISAVRFVVAVTGQRIPFALPCRWKEIHTLLVNRYKKTMTDAQRETVVAQAKRVAWRQILRWLQAQMAMVETGMVRIEEVFMPYLVLDKKGTTLYQVVAERGAGFLLEGPKS